MASPMFKLLRLAEVQDSIELLRKYKVSGELLEIGAGTGWQSKALSEAGYHVESVDLAAEHEISNHALLREWPISDYDGAQLPFADRTFDVIFSSNVLEHVIELETLTREMKRVLRPEGIALHVVPNSAWRLLSLATYYPAQAIDAFRWLSRKRNARPEGTIAPSFATGADQTLIGKAARRLIPHAHGSVGTPITELRRFSKRSWDHYFLRSGWEVLHYGDNGMIASGDYLLGELLPLAQRRRFGRLTGGIAHVYVVQPAGGP